MSARKNEELKQDWESEVSCILKSLQGREKSDVSCILKKLQECKDESSGKLSPELEALAVELIAICRGGEKSIKDELAPLKVRLAVALWKHDMQIALSDLGTAISELPENNKLKKEMERIKKDLELIQKELPTELLLAVDKCNYFSWYKKSITFYGY